MTLEHQVIHSVVPGHDWDVVLWGNVYSVMAVGQSKVFALGNYGVADGAAAPTSPDRGK